MAIQLVKTTQGRKRFLISAPIPDFNNWLLHLVKHKQFISRESSLSMVGRKISFEMSSPDISPKMMLEVIGPPMAIKDEVYTLVDLEESEIFIHKFLDSDLFSCDFGQLLGYAWSLKQSLDAVFKKQNDNLGTIFHIVFNLNKIELHFFRQKDYIQKQF
ncbi:MAG: hypothetical protein Q7U04_16490 [Bacteriovorax sp.]|nr:hypothetical protein [Bacteriovorax sp.]